MQSKNKTIVYIIGFTLLLLGLFVIAILVGRYTITLDNFLKIISGNNAAPTVDRNIVINLRIPRTIVALLTGMALSVSGLVYQEIFNNKLVSPDLLGVSSGASVGAALAIVLGFTGLVVSCFSFVFGLITMLLTLLISKVFRSQSSVFLLLAGVIVGGFMSSSTGLFKYLATSDRQLAEITFWLMGSFSSSTYSSVLILLPIVLVGVLAIFLLRWRINVLSLGHNEATSVGVNYKLLRMVIIVSATLLTAGTVAIAGVIGWVGLVIPHIARQLVGRNAKRTIPVTIIFGACFMIVVDIISRSFTSTEIPLSVVTGFLGTPIFLTILYMKRGVVSERD
ncbi:MAG: iron ABC transporter permease [Candidatus Izemoplasmatales bacterium]